MRLAANARMYAVTPAVKAAWQDLFAFVARASGVPLAYLDHACLGPSSLGGVVDLSFERLLVRS